MFDTDSAVLKFLTAQDTEYGAYSTASMAGYGFSSLKEHKG